MEDDTKGKLVLTTAILGFLFGIFWACTHHFKPIIGDCGVNVEANLLYAKWSMWATKFLCSIVFGLIGTLAGIGVLLICEAYFGVKHLIENRANKTDSNEFEHTKYSPRFLLKKTFHLVIHPAFCMLAIPVTMMFLYGYVLNTMPDACYVAKDSQSDFIMSTFLSLFLVTATLGGLISWLLNSYKDEIENFIFTVQSRTSLDSINCDIGELKLIQFFPEGEFSEINDSAVKWSKAGVERILSISERCNSGYTAKIYDKHYNIIRLTRLYNYTLREAVNYLRNDIKNVA